MRETWYYIETYSESAARNMAIDDVMMQKVHNENCPPILRFYSWQPKGLSLGYFQKINGKIDINRAAAQGADIVRRLTGGRAVLHDDELTYSVILPESHPAMPSSVTESYKILSQGLLEGYRHLDIPAVMATQKNDGKPDGSAVCFEEPSWYELLVNGKKAAGSAQVRKQGVILQHGSIPITVDTDALYDLFIYPSEKVKTRMREGFSSKATSIAAELGKRPDFSNVAEAFYTGFKQGLNLDFQQYTFTEEEEVKIEQLTKEKYTFSTAQV